MLKKLSAEGMFEAGLPEKFAGKMYAYVAVVEKGYIGLGIAVANEQGYGRSAALIVCSTMKFGKQPHDPSNASCPRNADTRNETCSC